MDAESFCGSYELTHFNAKRTATKALVHFSREGNELKVFAVVANSLRGRVTFAEGRLTGILMSTMMMGNDEQMEIENALSGGFGQGFDVRRENDRVLLKNESSSFIFVKTMSIDDLTGEHAIISVNGEAPAEDLTIQFVPDGNGGSFVIADVVNCIRGNCRVDAGVLQGEVASTSMDTEEAVTAIEEQIKQGLHRGYHVSKNDTGFLLESDGSTLQLYHVVTREEIAGEYLLKAHNGEPVHTNQQSTITFLPDEASDSQVNIFIVVANRIRGAAVLEQNVLRSEEPLLSTRMMGSEEESSLEAAYNAGFQYGLEVVYRNKEILLRDDDNQFLLVRVSTVQTEGAGATYKGTYVGKCFKAQGNGLLFRIVNEHEKRWAFYNDTKNYKMHVQASFGSRSTIEPLGNTHMERGDDGRFIAEVTVQPQETEMFIEGDVNGLRLQYNAEPI